MTTGSTTAGAITVEAIMFMSQVRHSRYYTREMCFIIITKQCSVDNLIGFSPWFPPSSNVVIFTVVYK